MRADWLNLAIIALFACAALKGALYLAEFLKGVL
jgi:hypothetical protein